MKKSFLSISILVFGVLYASLVFAETVYLVCEGTRTQSFSGLGDLPSDPETKSYTLINGRFLGEQYDCPIVTPARTLCVLGAEINDQETGTLSFNITLDLDRLRGSMTETSTTEYLASTFLRRSPALSPFVGNQRTVTVGTRFEGTCRVAQPQLP